MEEVNEGAFCPLLWVRNGGRLGPRGRVLWEENISGRCPDPVDCYKCGVMQEALANLSAQGMNHAWICPQCVTDVSLEIKENALNASLAGYFSEGYCQRPHCQRAAEDPEEPELRHSIIVQLLTFEGDIP